MTLEADFLTSAADKLAENLNRIETCLTELPPHALWARDSENENAVGNLLLHLEGNVRQWILSGIGAVPVERDRSGEFSRSMRWCQIEGRPRPERSSPCARPSPARWRI